ncbi:ArsR family transcriptional regulator [Niallia oryzisoli]|uniref:ArsR family transcriptional regulator n=1 Tax=Niallia oryzisoli TaxID=1737571 RepID=UPI003736123B
MSIRLGLIGVEDNLEWIQSVVKEYSDFECIPFLHFYEKDVIDILEAHSHDMDMWLFSGIFPYSVAEKWGGVSKPMFYVPYTGTSLYKSLYRILYHHHLDINQLSFDALKKSELKQIFAELDIDFPSSNLYEEPKSIEEVVKYHERLWKKGETQAAVTCTWQVQKELEKMGVPVYRVTHTKSAIKAVLDKALKTQEMLRFKDRQIAVQILEMDLFSSMTISSFSSDEIYDMEIKNTQKLLKYAKRIQGSLKTVSPGCYVIFTTHGELSDITDNFSVIPNIAEIQDITKGNITCGIGIGQSAYDAEMMARNALLQARKFGKENWMVAFDDKTFKGPLGKSESLTYSYNDKDMQTISEKTSLSIATISKIDSILTKMNRYEITCQELATQLQILPRSARRIVSQLEKSGYAEEIGEETPNPRGRPRKVYRVLLKGQGDGSLGSEMNN